MTSTKIQNRTPTGPSHARHNQIWKSTSICTPLAQVFHGEAPVSGRCRQSRIIAQLGFLEGESFDRSSLLFDERRTTRARATLLAQFRSGVIETEELPDGYAFRLPGDCRWVAIIAEMIMTNQTIWRSRRWCRNCSVWANRDLRPCGSRVVGARPE